MGNDSGDELGDDAGAAFRAGPSGGALFPRLGGPLPLTREEAGSKAAALSELKSAGFPVPPGFVVTRAALDARSKDNQDAWDRQLQAAALMAGPGPYAVRSSAVAEDLPGASYAGMYESYLDVPGGDLPSAIIRCFGSADAGRVRAYQESLRLRPADHANVVLNADPDALPDAGDAAPAGVGTMAVLVQQMVDAVAAGVAFTANPLTGAPGRYGDLRCEGARGKSGGRVGARRGVVGAEWTGQPQEWCCCRAARICADEAKRDGGRRLGGQRRPALRLPAGRGVGGRPFRACPGPAGASDDSRSGTGGVAGPGKGRLASELPAR